MLKMTYLFWSSNSVRLADFNDIP